MTVLSNARRLHRSALAEEILQRMKQLFPTAEQGLVSASILLANTYASGGEMPKASRIRKELTQSGLKKVIGLSWTEVNGRLWVRRIPLLIIFLFRRET